VTQIANGLSTTTFTYDNNGNVTQKTVDGTTTTYVCDYANRLTALGAGGATTTYAYDCGQSRLSDRHLKRRQKSTRRSLRYAPDNDLAAKIGMPAVLNFQLLPDMGRMNG
jgi:YD repeat-containing protein